MSRDLLILQAWAGERALNDEDEAARPLWAQIAREVGDYLSPEPDSEPGLFDAVEVH